MTSEPATPNIDLAFAAGKEEGKFEARAAAERDVVALKGLLVRVLGSFHGDGITPELEHEARTLLANPAAAEPRWPSGPDFVFERLENLEAVRMSIRDCEGRHVQQVVYSTYHDALTQVCFTERRVRANVDLAALQEKRDPGE